MFRHLELHLSNANLDAAIRMTGRTRILRRVTPPPHPFQIRPAEPPDIPVLQNLIEKSVRVLQAQDYSQTQIEGALGTVLGLDTQLIADRTYYVVEAISDPAHQRIAGCGGWSKRKTLFGSDRGPGREDAFLDPLKDNARIRALFIHPDWARRGIGSLILAACESGAIAAGFQGFELAATLAGVRLFEARGYQTTGCVDVALPNGESLRVIRMWKAAPTSPALP
jgi:N-acetylglutamate synthase-like GNAT family acetyltransferase